MLVVMTLGIYISISIDHVAQETERTLKPNMFQYFTVYPLYALLCCQFTNVWLHIR